MKQVAKVERSSIGVLVHLKIFEGQGHQVLGSLPEHPESKYSKQIVIVGRYDVINSLE